MIEIFRYRYEDGQEPFSCWLAALRDTTAQARVRMRIRQLQMGNLGDCEPVGEGVLELRIHVGAGHRVCFGRHGRAVILLLCGGSKATQAADIKQAKELWAHWKRSQK